MRRKIFQIFVLLVVLMIGSGAWAREIFVSGEVLVRFKPNIIDMGIKEFSALPETANIRAASVRGLNKKFKIKKYERIFRHLSQADALADYYKVVFAKEKNIKEIIKAFGDDPNVFYAQPNYIYRANQTTPNDPLFSHQWGLTKIKADYAWDGTVGSSETVVAVIDSGADYTHADLINNLDTAHAYNYVSNNENAQDDEGHGTEVSGVIAASTNNGLGVAGTSWKAKILPLKALYPTSYGASGDTAVIAWAIADAPNRGAQIINMSFGISKSDIDFLGTGDDVMLQDAVNIAFGKGAMLIAAAGNEGSEDLNYPGACNHVLAVAATDQNDRRSIWNSMESSNYGSWVDVSAPGTAIYTTVLGNRYSSGGNAANGTSFSAPFTAGVAALIKAAAPNFTHQQIMDRIRATTDNIDALNPAYAGKLGTGRINALKAVGAIAKIDAPQAGAFLKGKINFYGTANGLGFNRYVLEALQNENLIATIEVKNTEVTGGYLGSWETSSLGGTYTIRLKVFSSGMTDETEININLDNSIPTAGISFPSNGVTVEGRVNILGTAKDRDFFDSYTLEYGSGSAPLSFNKILDAYTAVDNATLGAWETTGIEGLYTLRLTVRDKIGNTSTESISLNIRTVSTPTKEVVPQPGLPLTYALPNPFSRSGSGATAATTFNYYLADNFPATIYLFDLTGNLIWQKNYPAGENGGKYGNNNPPWDGKNLYGENVANGVYPYQIVAGGKVIGRGKIIVLN
jgi:subtilisin family serine protease